MRPQRRRAMRQGGSLPVYIPSTQESAPPTGSVFVMRPAGEDLVNNLCFRAFGTLAAVNDMATVCHMLMNSNTTPEARQKAERLLQSLYQAGYSMDQIRQQSEEFVHYMGQLPSVLVDEYGRPIDNTDH